MDKVLFYMLLILVVLPLVSCAGYGVGGDGVSCYQCNIFVQGTRNLCGGEERVFHNCTGCFKSYVRAFLHNQWESYLYTTAISRYCIRQAQTTRKEGCYVTTGASGYVRQCFCYSSLCNGATSTQSKTRTVLTLGFTISIYLILNKFLQNTSCEQ